ncbi:MAG: hypothetical protein ACTHYZ_07725 [Psychrobacter sp.]
MNKLKKTIFALIYIYILIKFFNFFTSPQIKIFNNTDAPIRFNSLQYIDTGEEPTIEELNDWKVNYKIEKSKSKSMTLYTKHRFVDNDIYFGIDYFYFGDYLTDENIDELDGVTFMNKPAFIGQSAYCSFKVEVYPNGKTNITPLRKNFCLKPFYYHSK